MKETLIFRHRQEYSVTDGERCLKEKVKGTLWSRLIEQEFARAVDLKNSGSGSKVGQYVGAR